MEEVRGEKHDIEAEGTQSPDRKEVAQAWNSGGDDDRPSIFELHLYCSVCSATIGGGLCADLTAQK
jgi:hypothetical protein